MSQPQSTRTSTCGEPMVVAPLAALRQIGEAFPAVTDAGEQVFALPDTPETRAALIRLTEIAHAADRALA